MLVVTGVLLGAVLLVMVGEQVQEMQMANWLSTTELPSLDRLLPGWMRLWFSTFPNVEGLVAKCLAAAAVFGSYLIAQKPNEAAAHQAAKRQQMAAQL
jgi:high-affinity iron transporter